MAGHPAGSAPVRSLVGYTSQSLSVYTDISVENNLRYFARLYRQSEHSIPNLLDRLGLKSLAKRKVRTLSGGQAGRVSLECALVAEPRVLILDEPTVGLDPEARNELWNLFHERAKNGVAILLSSHVLEEARRCDDVLLMSDGRIIAHEPSGDICHRTGTTNCDEAFLTLLQEYR